ncbi:MAG: glycosyltransferase [Acetatifactor sp.]|nr:glycosyltransferase [Acetatifactor sp.]
MRGEEITICYVASICSHKKYNDYYGCKKRKPAQQSVKYHRLLAEGFWCNVSKVYAVCNIPMTDEVTEKYCKNQDELENGIEYRYVSFLKNPVIKHFMMIVGAFFKVRKILKENENVVIVFDVLSRSVSLGAMLAAGSRAKAKVAVVTDLPEMFKGAKYHLSYYISEYLMKRASGYTFMTGAMDEKANPTHKPSVIMEGHVDIREKSRDSRETIKNGFKCIYAGAVSKEYGLDELVKGFLAAGIPDSELEIYGNGDYAKDVERISDSSMLISYKGEKKNEEVVDSEYGASLLINPRPTKEEFVKYSFPSKNMEYMVTGTPVLTTNLPGMPDEYKNHVYLIEDETADGIKTVLQKIAGIPEEERNAMGKKAREYVLEEKNNVIQAKRVLSMIEGFFDE